VLKLKVDLIATLAQKGTFTRTSAGFCLNELVDKVGDVKNGASVQEALSCMAEAISLNYIGTEVYHVYINKQKKQRFHLLHIWVVYYYKCSAVVTNNGDNSYVVLTVIK